MKDSIAKENNRLAYLDKIYLRRAHFAGLIFLIAVVLQSKTSSAALIDFQSYAWNASDQHIYRNGEAIIEPATETIPGSADGVDFYFVKSSYDRFSDISFSGAGVGNPQIYQHICAYSLPEASTFYTVENSTGHSRTFNFSAGEIGNHKVKRFRYKDNIVLNGSLLLTTQSFQDKNLKGLLASFELNVTREIQKGSKTKTKKLKKGTIKLYGKKNGKIKIKTKGGIKKRHISQVIQDNNLIRIDFINEHIPYSTRVKVGQDFSIVTSIYSKAVTLGEGTGAEVIFGPGEPSIPVFLESGEIPEPTTVLVLTAGMILGIRRRIISKRN